MKRLTEVDGTGNWHIAGVEWGNVKGNLYGALCKLKDYEDTGLSPAEVAELNTFDGSQAVKATAKPQEEQRKHRWIPVSERLPTMEEYDRSAAKFIVSDGNKAYEDLFDIYDQCWLDSQNGAVIAWMPLPEPYRKD